MCIFFTVGTVRQGSALNYFGDLAAHKLTIQCHAAPGATREQLVTLQIFGGAAEPYLLLRQGRILLSKDDMGSCDPGQLCVGKLDLALRPERIAEFKFREGGWGADETDLLVRIPFVVQRDDPKQMVQFADEGELSLLTHDNASSTVSASFYDNGAPVKLSCRVLESTLGLNNQLDLPVQSVDPARAH
jgi:hypothetical protein